MFAKYVSLNSNVGAIASDLAKLACGYAINALSASCNKVATEILSNVVAPGWTMVDADIAGSTGSVISCPDADGVHIKRVKIYTGNDFDISMQAVETWNPATHATTNGANSPGILGPLPSPVGATTYWLIATPRTLYFFQQTSPTPLATGIGCVEFTRDAAYLQDMKYPCHVIIGDRGLTQGQSATSSRIKNQVAAGDTLAPGSFVICTMAARSAAGNVKSTPAMFRDANDTPYYEVRPVWIGWFGAPGNGFTSPLILGKLHDFVETASIRGNLFNTFTDGVDTWTIVTADEEGPSACVAIKAV